MITALSAQTELRALRLIDDHAEYMRLPTAARNKLLQRLDWVDRINGAPRGSKAPIVTAASIDLDVSEGAIRRYLTWFDQEGWRGLKDTRGKGTGTKGTPEAWQDWIRTLWLQNKRAQTGREIARLVYEQLSKWRRTGEARWAIPGYCSPPPNSPKGYPVGWSEDQILRLRPDEYSLAVANGGTKAGAKFLPDLLKTRVGTRFGQFVFFDDQDYDNKIVAPGTSKQTLRAQGFNALEYHSGAFLEYCIRLRWWDMTKQQFRTLTGIEATWFQITYLQKVGYRDDDYGTTIIQEHGTMKGFDNKELSTPQGYHSLGNALLNLSAGRIRTIASGLYNQPAFAGMLFRPQSSGNPDFKAPLEGMFNLVRNRFAALPGATGRSRDHAPSEQYGQDLYVKQMLKVWETLDDRHREMVRWPVMTVQQFGEAAAAVYRAINARTEHDLEGWARLGHVVPQFRWTPDDSSRWLSQQELAALSPKQLAAAEALMETEGYTRPLKLAPIHVADLYRGELTKIPDHWIPLLIPVQWAREVTVDSSREFHIKDQMLGPEAFHYIARFRDGDSVRTMKPGTKLLVYLNPFDTSRVYVCRADGSWLGVLHEKSRPTFMDSDAITELLHERAEMKADMDLEVRPHLEGLIKHRGEMKAVNDRLKDGKPVTDEEIADARSEAAQRGVTTRRAKAWQDDGNAAETALQPDEAPTDTIPTEDIASWLKD